MHRYLGVYLHPRYGLLGASGCGKTTLLSCLVGRHLIDFGQIRVFIRKLICEFRIYAESGPIFRVPVRNDGPGHRQDVPSAQQTTQLARGRESVVWGAQIGLMREGVLLEESEPQSLLLRYSCSSLEEAFLYLCFRHSKEKAESKKNEDPPLTVQCSPVLHSPLVSNEYISWSRFKAQLLKQFIWIKRNLLVMSYVVFLPLICMYVFNCAVGLFPSPLRLALINEETNGHPPVSCSQSVDTGCNLTGPMSCRYMQKIEKIGKVELVQFNNMAEAREAVGHGKLWGTMQFTSNFTQSFLNRYEMGRDTEPLDIYHSNVYLSLDMTDFITSFYLQGLMYDSFRQFYGDFLEACGNHRNVSHSPPLRFETPVFGRLDRPMWYPRTYSIGLMREGVLLEESEPQSLLLRYSCSSLEEAFLYLCFRHSKEKAESKVQFNNMAEAREAVGHGKLWGTMQFTPNFTQSFLNRYEMGRDTEPLDIYHSNVYLSLDMTDFITSFYLQGLMYDSFRQFYGDFLEACGNHRNVSHSPPLRFETPVFGSFTASYSEFTAPAVICLKENRKIFYGDPWITFLLVYLQGICGTMFGILICFITKQEQLAGFGIMAASIPIMTLSGLIWPVQAQPDYLRYFSQMLPITCSIDAVRGLTIRGYPFSHPMVYMGFVSSICWSFVLVLWSYIQVKRNDGAP
ncbi:uncharacterized protein LOC103514720 [Diaphorina citri]|uniref:Uncharacterized protein LOC103514720 n=1 Tax=Diaphorina citri TaxID=121845 RepID=A0A3Q0J8X3_DIACI|nr:uncharacterized protein LOC103514720 [Diaphorina citri]